jgi:hypothetical protein
MQEGSTLMKYSGIFMRSIAILGFVVAMLSAGSLVNQSAAGEAAVYMAVDSYVWKEFEDDGSLLLKESGELFGIGFTYQHEFSNHMTLRPTAEIFGGSVDYDGQTQAGIAATSTVDYFGLKLEGDVGVKFRMAERFFLEPFGGLGLRLWTRDINDGKTASGATTYGYREGWVTWHARLGLRGGVDISPKSRLFAEAGMKLPIYNENTAYLAEKGIGPDVTMHPGKESSFFAETGLQASWFRGSLFYEGMRFSKSSEVTTTDGSFIYTTWQPRSEADIYGLKLGVVF